MKKTSVIVAVAGCMLGGAAVVWAAGGAVKSCDSEGIDYKGIKVTAHADCNGGATGCEGDWITDAQGRHTGVTVKCLYNNRLESGGPAEL